jgi:ABC-type branched-subunit amino acid transport system permease subunit
MSWRAAAAAALVTATVCFLIARGNSYQTFIIVTVGLTAIVGTGLNVLLGLSGQISLGHVAFYAIGAYAVGILTTALDWPFWPALAVGGLVAGLAGVLLAIPALRVRGPYLAMVTIAFGEHTTMPLHRSLAHEDPSPCPYGGRWRVPGSAPLPQQPPGGRHNSRPGRKRKNQRFQ